MNRIIVFILSILLCVGLLGCSGAFSSDSIVGTWNQIAVEINGTKQDVNMNYSLIFNADQTGTYLINGDTGNLTWSEVAAGYQVTFDDGSGVLARLSGSNFELMVEAGTVIFAK